MFMPMSQLSIPEGIVRLTHAFVEDASLRAWFLTVQEHSPGMRRAAFRQMAEQMRTAGEDPELATAVSALTHPELFDAVRQSLRDRCGV
jgi:hypothetical protein